MIVDSKIGHTSWIEVSKEGLVHNLWQIRKHVKPSVKVMGVVKANAYGHGLSQVAHIFADEGIDYFGVTTIEEGLAIRNSGIEVPILIFAPLLDDQIDAAIVGNLDMTVSDLDQAKMISKHATYLKLIARIHIKVDTGMGRLGFYPDECIGLIDELIALPGISLTGIYTHFADAGSNNRQKTMAQIGRFEHVIGKLKSKGINPGIVHAANSAGLINYPQSHLDMVRPGTVLYGQYPSRYCKKIFQLMNTWCFKTRIIAIRNIRRNETIGYGSEYRARRNMKVAVIPVGYSDGFGVVPQSLIRMRCTPFKTIFNALGRRINSNTPHVYIGNMMVPVVGRISMQMVSLDITNIEGVKSGDTVVVPMRRTAASDRVSRIIV